MPPRRGVRPERPEAVIFLHIPKTGGITLRRIIERQYDRRVVHSVGDPYWSFYELPEAERSRIRLLQGHMPFGLHAALPGPSTYVTMLRDPIERVISEYHYLLRTPTAKFHETVTARGMSLGDVVREGLSVEFDNHQTRLLSDDPWVPFGSCSDEMLEQAKRNLGERFAVVGLLERFDESVLLMKSRLGWRRPVYYVRRNVTRGRPAPASLPPDTRALIERTHGFDVELYRYATELFEAQAASEPSFAARVARFRRLNRALGAVFGLAGPAVRRARRMVSGR
jgi:hypothetical protein